jgi:glycosyltransferase involved in cell wall biosynthesis
VRASKGRSVSVVIPTYNLAPLLPGAVASARAQEWPELEIIVVDDGSTDETQEVLKRLAVEAPLRWFRQENAGAAAARNRGIREARGEWVAFLDADDFWLPGKLAAQFEELERRPSAAFSYTDVRLREESGSESDLACGTTAQPLLPQMLAGNMFATPTALVRRECFDEVGLFDARLRTGEDWDMWLRLASHFECVRVARPLTLVRRVGHSKFPLHVLESCTLLVLERLFSCPHVARAWPEVASKRGAVYAWHYSVLAKSYLRRGRLADFLRLAYMAVRSHPSGLRYVARASRGVLDRVSFA